eukprot:gene10900-2975_t
MPKPLVAILLFDNVEVLDFAGPFEVFSVAAQLSNYQLLDVTTVAQTKTLVRAKNGLVVMPELTTSDLDHVDILVIPGGEGSLAIIQDSVLLQWIEQVARNAQIVFSVCSGARVLAKLGLLAGQQFTTHCSAFDNILELEPTAIPNRKVRFVDNGKIMTAAGVAAGIDLSLYVVEKYFGKEIRESVSAYMEYDNDVKA